MADHAARREVGVVLVGFRSGSGLLERAENLRAEGFEVRVVDNAGEYGDAEVLAPGSNLGFGAACNLAVADLPPAVTTVVLHNPDVEARGDEIDGLVAELRAQPVPGIVSAAEQVPGEGVRRGYRYPSPRRELVVALGARSATMAVIAERIRAARPDRAASTADAAPVFGSAALMAIDRPRFEAVGGFDERYFLYVEDLDLWDRVRCSGADVAISREAVTHEVGTGSDASRTRRELLRWLGVQLFLQDRSGPGAWRGARLSHRLALALSGGPRDELERAVLAHWRAGESPAEVQALLRPVLTGAASNRPTDATAGVDVVVTCHDYGRFLEEAVASVDAQTFPAASIVVIDDASTDDTPEVVAGLVAARKGLVAVRSEERLGVAVARNTGLAMGSAPCVCFLDADDRMPPEYLERLVAAVADGADIAFAPLRPFGPGAGSVRPVTGYDPELQIVDNQINASAVFRRELVERAGGMSSSLDGLGFEDWDFWLRLVASGARVAYVDDTALDYRRHGEGSRNTPPGVQRVLARLVVWWRSRRLLRARHVARWAGPGARRALVATRDRR